MVGDLKPVTDATDVGIVNLTDRRKIAALETKVEGLERELADARAGKVTPAITRDLATCHHHARFLVAENTPEVKCEACGAIVDPYEVLRRIAMREVNFCYTLSTLRKEATDLRAEVDKLKDKRSYLRTRVRKERGPADWTEIAKAMRAAGADTFAIRAVGSMTAAWFYTGKRIVQSSGPHNVPEDAIAELVERSAVSSGAKSP